jgi:hypothetical protein
LDCSEFNMSNHLRLTRGIYLQEIQEISYLEIFLIDHLIIIFEVLVDIYFHPCRCYEVAKINLCS